MSGWSRDARGSALRGYRQAAGLTQQQLADLSELSVRTVRGLENEAAAEPRVESLTRLAAALGLPSATRTDMLTAWGHIEKDESNLLEQLYAGEQTGQAALRALVRARVAQTSYLTWLSTVVVGPDRRIASRQVDKILVARVDAVRGEAQICEPTSPVALALVELRPIGGCRVLRARTLPQLGVKVFDVDFGVVLRRGAVHRISYLNDYRRATEVIPQQPGSVSSDVTGDGFYRKVPTYSLQVSFQDEDLPKRCIRVYRPRPDARVTEIEQVPVTAWGSAQFTIQDAKPGNHGMKWEW